MTINSHYNSAPPGSLPVKIATNQRRKMFAAFVGNTGVSADDTVLDVGATSDHSFENSNYFEAWFPHKRQLTAVGVDDASFLAVAYPGLTFIRADGRRLPFKDASFDFVHSNAVLEHVGSRERQMIFLREVWRVARKGVFVTTPNRWFPVEFHTVLPLAHWLPAPFFRSILRTLGMDFFAREENLNLLSRHDLARMARRAGIEGFDIRVASLLGWPTNLLLCAARQAK